MIETLNDAARKILNKTDLVITAITNTTVTFGHQEGEKLYQISANGWARKWSGSRWWQLNPKSMGHANAWSRQSVPLSRLRCTMSNCSDLVLNNYTR